jgi:serine/threonine protein kinase/Tfp pilus assembly protein PilF
MPDESEQDQRVMAAVSRLLRLAPLERERYVAVVAGGDKLLELEILETLRWEERMEGFLQQSIARFPLGGARFTAGQVIAERFEILREIGEGGMGVVYAAFDRKRQQTIAVKCAKPGCANFLKPELQGALKVRHPNVCLVNEIHSAQVASEAIDFLTMELLEGEPLGIWLSGRKQDSLEEPFAIASQLYGGLAEAHRCGVIHRDLKPSNIIVCDEPGGGVRAVITDFGLAGEASETEAVWGTPAYMAPELWRGAKASRASDIYALGVLLHEIMPPGDGSRAEYRKLIEEFVHIDPARRLHAFARAGRFLHRLPRPAWYTPWLRRRKATLAAGGLFALACALGLWRWDAVQNLLHPLPEKRYVAILGESQQARSISSDIESELVRAERTDRNLLVVSSRGLKAATGEADLLERLRTSFGANLALLLEVQSTQSHVHLDLRLVETATGKLLRQRQLDCRNDDCRSLNRAAIESAAGILGIGTDPLNLESLRPATRSPLALASFQAAEELRSKPNDSGLEAAIEQYKKAIEADPQYAPAHAELARAYCRLYGMRGDPAVLEFARLNAERAIQLDEERPEAHAALAFVHENTGNEQAALREIQRALTLDPSAPRLLLWEADIYLHFGKWRQAAETYKQLQAERPNYWLPYQQLGVLLSEQGRYEEAKESFHAATVAAPWSALGFDNLGMMLLKLGRLDEAKENFRKCLALHSEDYGAHVNMAEALRDEAKYPQALAHLQEALRIQPADDQSWLGLADCYEKIPDQREAREAYARAATEVRQILKTEPNSGGALIRLALYEAKTGARETAAEVLRKADEAGIGDIDSQLTKARVLAVLDRREEAARTVKACLRRGATIFEIRSIEDLKAFAGDSATKP